MINGTRLNLTQQFLAEATEGFATDITGASDIQGGGRMGETLLVSLTTFAF